MSTLMRLAHRLQRRLWKVLRPRTTGVKVMLFDADGKILLIRNSYGATDQFVFPGGGVRPWEHPAIAARREVLEEVGCSVEGLVPVSTHFTSAEGKRDTVHLFEARTDGVPQVDRAEVIEARFFALDALPKNLSPATARRLAERSGKVEANGSW